MKLDQRLIKPILLCWLLFIAIATLGYLRVANDYVGQDNDDVLRLVQIRDWLNGQSWFDLTQYRLGLEGGTLMHWSRLVDFPIASLIQFFSLFVTRQSAEAISLFLWPILTAFPVVCGFAHTGRILSPKMGAPIGAIGSVAFLIGVGKFDPGAIDHHNVQIAIFSLLVPVLIAPSPNWRAYFAAGLLCALAIAIGAETTPLVAVYCAIISFAWAWHGGKTWRRPTRLFALGLSFSLTLIFFSTTPPHLYSLVACDSLSLGFYSLGIVGAVLLFLASALLSYQSRLIRFAALGVIGFIVAIVALIVSPQCLQSPLADLHPLIKEMWLDHVTEARSFRAILANKPEDILGLYVVPAFALTVCAIKFLTDLKSTALLRLSALLLLAFLISFVQARGSLFAHLFAMMALVGLVADLRNRSSEDPKNIRIALYFTLCSFLSLPIVWSALGASISKLKEQSGDTIDMTSEGATSCTDQIAMKQLGQEAKGVVAAPSNLSAHILRFTHHRVLTGPYHRNQAGILAELQIGLAGIDDAIKHIYEAKVTLIAFCKSDPQVGILSAKAPEGLYSQLSESKIPPYLDLVPQTEGKAIEIYRVRTAENSN